MLIALWKIRRFLVKRGLGQMMKPVRMIIHALVFLIYVLTFFVLTVIVRLQDHSGEKLFYFHWLVCIILGWLAYICLACVLWHLGTKQTYKDVADIVDSCSTAETVSTKIQDESLLLYAE